MLQTVNTPLTECKYLLFDASGLLFNIEYKYVYRIPKGPYLDCSYNSVWLLYWLWWDETSNYFATQADIMIDILYDLDKD